MSTLAALVVLCQVASGQITCDPQPMSPAMCAMRASATNAICLSTNTQRDMSVTDYLKGN